MKEHFPYKPFTWTTIPKRGLQNCSKYNLLCSIDIFHYKRCPKIIQENSIHNDMEMIKYKNMINNVFGRMKNLG